ncbi:hypothetical protein HT102_10200 [Hoyosella sp. G463]|uniref:Lipoprotein n=1 Tax=Lolliginicoccus lacisalsi TaxID=2742202 RepID=A0A927JCL8_9ACTN|nr:hypothetical protein [Lolliginicoccus lacisalsi]MBD8506859.1 hypothetical protein [Lolliginicoccus lacisalsi]
MIAPSPAARGIAAVVLASATLGCAGPMTSEPASPSAMGAPSAAGDPQPQRVQSATLRGYGSISIVDPGKPASAPTRITDVPRVYASESAILVQTGTPYGPHDVEAHSYTEEPRPEDPGSWDEAIHAIISAATDIRLEAGGSDGLPGLELPLSLQGPGEYNVRLYTRGHGTNQGQLDSLAEEKYLIQVWQA